ncbi:bifunctional 4-hydroxy-2-oxoglutarate aldolase/2-dehydro-3-deoxy-phosphogluconate aldolase [Paenibacillus sp. CGMCC 1.16610]|uniref:Bifunctional 4-hydroxy-2-oxoglutarate aldolase/2-dehydro-3-deoxy-phosphogluconate aldolase n=1 Tax=Paenibacillus anseongense TaxID=2682845 RepID=A0ABW9UCB9_9BACL|nr:MULTISPECIES: bifunctional 4-hydroxy-2-oxoglutarate aldolase/2-dehydro-3-deoxy-phosphogluconate aldolase [Paenibacillus]MBA2943915.1 bifunctional 4-hydroxy-2-oxoglutarate aldolase/2-dehydro-3-deoxy-phosphogluconate aldolase [Paenibacillus sp. CGMCC 1.16610]MVQ37804.1 bifunctional 4-hydroxy-2-oxoglutarate aldolase/2-dehydro-3-deoxy-phosphogluconate aldolase [Paenibacillus anseongense]
MNREQGLKEIERTRIIAIVRGVKEAHIFSVAEALLKGGVTVMEVTLNTPGALTMISELQAKLGEQMYIGAGTVLDVEDAQKAVQAGAAFLVTPNLDEDVIRYASREGVPIFPGAMTPTEVVKAWKAGATAIKIFPSASLGLSYIKELMGPLDHIPMMAVGGVTEENIKQFLDLGCYGLGIGGSLINLKEIEAGRFEWVTDKAARLIAASR